MKNDTLKMGYIMAILLALAMSSCDALLDDNVVDYGEGPNFVGFEAATMTLDAPIDEGEVPEEIPIVVIGPSVYQIDRDLTITVTVDPSSTAVEGVHYLLGSNTLLLPLASNTGDTFTGNLPITLLTDGVGANDPSPVLHLVIGEISGEANVVINDKTKEVALSLAYSAP